MRHCAWLWQVYTCTHTISILHNEQRWHTFPGAHLIFTVCVSMNPHLRHSLFIISVLTHLAHSTQQLSRHIWLPKGLIITVSDFSVILHSFFQANPHCPNTNICSPWSPYEPHRGSAAIKHSHFLLKYDSRLQRAGWSELTSEKMTTNKKGEYWFNFNELRCRTWIYSSCFFVYMYLCFSKCLLMLVYYGVYWQFRLKEP